jgi:hypothetical protein
VLTTSFVIMAYVNDGGKREFDDEITIRF